LHFSIRDLRTDDDDCRSGKPVSAAGNILVCFAMEDEARAFRKLAAGRDRISICVTGIGQKNAERAVCEFLAAHSPPQVFTCGFAGGLNPELKTGELIYATDDAGLAAKLVHGGARAVQFYCSPRIATTTTEKGELRRTTGADAVEMESAIIQAVCRERGIPCATIRAISDAAGDPLPLDFNQLANADQSLNYGKLAWAIARAPKTIPALLQLQRRCRVAADNLATMLLKLCTGVGLSR
jgi:nucleoside phosphorylase